MVRHLIIDNKYIEDIARGGDGGWASFTAELSSLESEDIVELKRPIRPAFGSTYKDVRAHVAAMANRGYLIYAPNPLDAEKICSVMGGGQYVTVSQNTYTRRAA